MYRLKIPSTVLENLNFDLLDYEEKSVNKILL